LVLELSADVPTFREINGSDCAPGGRADSTIEIGSKGTFSLAGGAVCGRLKFGAQGRLRMLAKVEKWMVIIREINREWPDRHRVDCVI
jgi:hypothetical protein